MNKMKLIWTVFLLNSTIFFFGCAFFISFFRCIPALHRTGRSSQTKHLWWNCQLCKLVWRSSAVRNAVKISAHLHSENMHIIIKCMAFLWKKWLHTWHIFTNFICKTIGLLVVKVVMQNWQSYETEIFQLLSSLKTILL